MLGEVTPRADAAAAAKGHQIVPDPLIPDPEVHLALAVAVETIKAVRLGRFVELRVEVQQPGVDADPVALRGC